MVIYLNDIIPDRALYPFGQVKSAAYIRIGMLNILEKWQSFFGDKVILKSAQPEPPTKNYKEFSILDIPSNKAFRQLVNGKQPGPEDFVHLASSADIFKHNRWALAQDYDLLAAKKERADIPEYVYAKAKVNIFIEKGADIRPCFINAEEGPVYISANAQVLEGAMLRGPLFVGKNSVVKMGARIYGSTTIGPFCMVGGEIKNSVLMGYSNKAHDGYLGDSVIGEWCNLGAGTSSSNLKNNGSIVSITVDPSEPPIRVGIKCGLLMGDYTRSAINTSFNTGSVIGICCNLYGENPEKYVPSFSWGKEAKYRLEKLLDDIDNWKKLKGFDISDEEKESISKLYDKL